MICSGGNPVVASGKRRPLHIDHEPWEAVAAQPAWRTPRRVEVYDGKTFGAGRALVRGQIRVVRGEARDPHDARATSRPDGEMVADPTRPSTWMVPSASKLSLSKADFIVLTFFVGTSASRTKERGMAYEWHKYKVSSMASDERLSNLKFRGPPSALCRASPRPRQCLFEWRKKKREYPQSRIWLPNAMRVHSSSCGWAAPMSTRIQWVTGEA